MSLYIYTYIHMYLYTYMSHGIASFPHHPHLLWFREPGLWFQPVWSCLGASLTMRPTWTHLENAAKHALKFLLSFNFLLGQHYWASDFSKTAETGWDDGAEASWHARKAPAAHHRSFRGQFQPGAANQPLLLCWVLPVPWRSMYFWPWPDQDVHLQLLVQAQSSPSLRGHCRMGTDSCHLLHLLLLTPWQRLHRPHLSFPSWPSSPSYLSYLSYLSCLSCLSFPFFFHFHRGGCIAFRFCILCLSNRCNVKVVTIVVVHIHSETVETSLCLCNVSSASTDRILYNLTVQSIVHSEG